MQLLEEVLKPQEQTDEQNDDNDDESAMKEAGLTYFNLEPMLSECIFVHVSVQVGRDFEQVCR